MNAPVLNNFNSKSASPSPWRRFGWAFALGIIILAGIGWYVSGKFSISDQAVIVPSAPSDQNEIAAAPRPAVSRPSSHTSAPITSGIVYDYTQAPQHIGENAKVRGQVLDVFTSSKGTIFLDFCKSSETCPFSSVIFSSDVPKFHSPDSLEGKTVIISGILRSYQNQAEIILENPVQITPL